MTGKINIKAVKRKVGLLQRRLDIARSRNIYMKDMLSFDLGDETSPFEPKDYNFNKDKEISTSIVVISRSDESFLGLLKKQRKFAESF